MKILMLYTWRLMVFIGGALSNQIVYDLVKSQNISIALGRSGRFPCQLKAASLGQTFSFSKIDVLWIIDGFGYTRDDLTTIFNDRFHVNHDINNGNFDLTLSNVTMKDDESSFMCQINYKLDDNEKLVTISSDLAHLTVIISPKQVSLVQKVKFSSYDETKIIKEISGKIMNTEMVAIETQVADAPHSQGQSNLNFDLVQFSKQHLKTPPINTLGSNNKQFVKSPQQVNNNNLMQSFWFVENQTIQIDCHNSASKPRVKLIWLLNGIRLENGRQNDDRGLVYTISERYYNETSLDNATLIQTVNTLEVIATSKVHNSQLECRVEYSDIFSSASLPIVTGIIKVAHVEKVNLRLKDSNDIMSGKKIYADCQAVSVPNEKVYLWTLVDDNKSRVKLASKENRVQHPVYNLNRPAYLKLYSSNYDVLLPMLHRSEKILTPYIHKNSSISLDVTKEFNYKSLRCWAGALPNNDHERITKVQPSWAFDEQFISVKYSAEIQGPLDESFAGNIGDSIQLQCSSDGNPQGEIRWYKVLPDETDLVEKLPLKKMQQIDFESLSRLKTFQRTSLLVGSVSVVFNLKLNGNDDFGLYLCSVSNGIEYPAIKRVTVDRPGPLEIVQPERIFGKLNEPGKISCKITGIPKPSANQVSWTRNNLPIIEDKNYQFYYENYPRGVEAILYFKGLSREDFAVYNCSAKNGYGMDWKTFELVTIDEIPMAFAIGSGTAILLAVLFSGIIFFIIRHSKRQMESRKEFQNIQNSKPNIPTYYNEKNPSVYTSSSMELRSSKNNLYGNVQPLGSQFMQAQSHNLNSPDSQTPLISSQFTGQPGINQYNNLPLFSLGSSTCYSPCDVDSKQCTFVTDTTFLSGDMMTNNESNQSFDSGTITDVYKFTGSSCSNVNPVYLSLQPDGHVKNQHNPESLPIFYRTTNAEPQIYNQRHLRF